jgi:hypothetical protein
MTNQFPDDSRWISFDGGRDREELDDIELGADAHLLHERALKLVS